MTQYITLTVTVLSYILFLIPADDVFGVGVVLWGLCFCFSEITFSLSCSINECVMLHGILCSHTSEFMFLICSLVLSLCVNVLF